MVIPKTIEEVEKMDQESLCRLWRFGPPEFWRSDNPIAGAAEARLLALGGITSEISKRIGW